MEQLGLSMNMAAMPVTGAVAPQAAVHPQRLHAAGSAVSSGPDRAEASGQVPATGTLRANVTEVILPPGQVENFQLLLPMLTQLNQERRWLAWIDPPQELVSKWQTMHGIVASELLVLRSSRDYSAFELAERALGAGTCHAVVMWTSRLSSHDFAALEQASAQGQSHGVILRTR